MTASASTVYPLLLAVLTGYLLGSIPMAAWVSRLRGVDIFSTGTGLAGAANVSRSVGRWPGGVVLVGDAAKGMLTVVAAYRLGLEGGLVLLPAMAALAGHCRSVFTRFRGGDGLSTLVGITLVVLPMYSLLSLVTGGIVALIARGTGHHPTLWGGTAGYGFLLLRIPMSEENSALVLGVALMALMVLAHGVVGHRRRAASV